MPPDKVKIIEKIKSVVRISLFFGFLFILGTFFVNVFSYFDPLNFCYIGIDNNILGGSQEAIKKAIKSIKEEDGESYRTLCKYVDAIIEQECLNFDPHIKQSAVPMEELKESACYVKGSRVIYVPRISEETNEAVADRAEMLKIYSQKSKDFWTSN